MTKNEFISQLREALEALPEEEREAALEYYSEYFDDAGEENQEKAAAELGDPQKVAEQVAASSPQKKYQAAAAVVPAEAAGRQAVPPESPYAVPDRRNRKTIIIILIVLVALFGSPVWLALLSCVIAYAGMTIGFVCGGVVGLFWAVSELFSTPAKGIYDLGASMVVFGLGALMTIPAVWAVLRWIPALGRWISRKWKEL